MTATARRPSISGRYSIPDTFDYPSQMMFDGRPTLTTSVAKFTKGRPRYASSFCCAAPWNYEYGQSPQEYTIGNMRESTVLDKKCTRPTNVTGICKVRNNSPRVRHHSRTSWDTEKKPEIQCAGNMDVPGPVLLTCPLASTYRPTLPPPPPLPF